MRTLTLAALTAGCVIAGVSMAAFVMLYGGIAGEAVSLILDLVFSVAQATAKACQFIVRI